MQNLIALNGLYYLTQCLLSLFGFQESWDIRLNDLINDAEITALIIECVHFLLLGIHFIKELVCQCTVSLKLFNIAFLQMVQSTLHKDFPPILRVFFVFSILSTFNFLFLVLKFYIFFVFPFDLLIM